MWVRSGWLIPSLGSHLAIWSQYSLDYALEMVSQRLGVHTVRTCASEIQQELLPAWLISRSAT